MLEEKKLTGKKLYKKLIIPILKLSLSKNWEKAKKEWIVINFRIDPDEKCICCVPIKNVFTIKNIETHEETDVGRICVTQFKEKKLEEQMDELEIQHEKQQMQSIAKVLINRLKNQKHINFKDLIEEPRPITFKRHPPFIFIKFNTKKEKMFFSILEDEFTKTFSFRLPMPIGDDFVLKTKGNRITQRIILKNDELFFI
jgi:hypothetical protein